VQGLSVEIDGVRDVLSGIDKEINESGATISNLRDNIIVQRLTMKMMKIQEEINSYDMEEAAKARRNYEDKYEPAKAKEEKLNEAVCACLVYPLDLSIFLTRLSRSFLVSSTDGRAWLSESSAENSGK